MIIRQLIALVLLTIGVTTPMSVADEQIPLEYEQVMKQHHASLARHAHLLTSLSATRNQNSFDVTYYDINISILPSQTRIVGIVRLAATALEPLDFVELDLNANMIVDSVTTGGVLTSYQHADNLLTIEVPLLEANETVETTVYYQGVPSYLGFGSFTFGRHNNLPAVATLSEPFFARTWLPCKDHPSDKADSADMRVTIDSRLTVVSNGTLVGITDNGDGTSTTSWHESYPITTYLVSLAIADYEHYADTFHYANESMPVDFYIFSGQVEQHRAANAETVQMLEYFSSVFGPYPFIREKYGHAQFSFGGGMEHQTCSSIGAFHVWLLAHELAHQWWGDMITCGTWHDIWLNEGFARYSEALWIQHKNGQEAFQAYIKSLIQLDHQVYVADTSNFANIFDRVVYDKGAMVLHMLRYNFGDDMFFEIIRTYADSRHKYNSATTADFQAVCEELSGRDLQYFFDQWVYQPTIPDYRYGFFSYETDSGWITDFQLEQVQTPYKLFLTDIDVLFISVDDSLKFRLTNNKRKQNYRLLLPEEPIDVQIDPDYWIVKQYTEVELLPQATIDILPDAVVGVPFSYKLEALGGLPPFVWSEYVATMPDGISVEDDGTIHGIAADTGRYEISVRIADARRPAVQATSNLQLRIRQVRGNIDDEQGLGLGDLLFFVRYLYRNGPAPADIESADANCDGDVDLVDLLTVLNFLYQQGPLPCFDS